MATTIYLSISTTYLLSTIYLSMYIPGGGLVFPGEGEQGRDLDSRWCILTAPKTDNYFKTT